MTDLPDVCRLGRRALSPAAVRALDAAVIAILRDRHPGIAWEVERLERDTLAAPREIGGRFAPSDHDDALPDRTATVRDDHDAVDH